MTSFAKNDSNQQDSAEINPQKNQKDNHQRNKSIELILNKLAQIKGSWWLTKGISLCCAGYLIAILFNGVPKDNRLTVNDIGFLALFLTFNSDILERLKTLQLNGKEGIAVELQPKLDANIKVNQRESEALIFLGQRLLQQAEDQKKFFNLFVNSPEELHILVTLYKYKNGEDVSLKYTDKLAPKLRHLRILNFIESPGERTVDSLENGEELTQVYRLTKWGEICHDLGPSPEN